MVILAAILFPVFAKAREAARRATCMSNLKQLISATLLYANDYDERFYPPLGAHASDYSWGYYWWGYVDSTAGTVDYTRGLIYPYTKNAQVKKCPTFVVSVRPVIGGLGYGYNYAYVGGDVGITWSFVNWPGTPATMADLQQPTDTIVLADSARSSMSDPTQIEENTYLDPPSMSFGFPTVHFRHNNLANVAFADGHVKALARTGQPSAYIPSLGDLGTDDTLWDRQ